MLKNTASDLVTSEQRTYTYIVYVCLKSFSLLCVCQYILSFAE